MVNAVSAMATFSTASSRLLSDIDRWFARAIWLAAWFQWTLALPSQNGASSRLSIGTRRSGSATERLDGIEVRRVRRARESSRRDRAGTACCFRRRTAR